jgi:hypothetical protein
MISKIEKARQYAEEPGRIQISELKATFHGSNGDHVITLHEGKWHSDSHGFVSWGTSPHIMAMQRVLGEMLTPAARQPTETTGVHMQSDMISKIEKARRYAEEPDRIQIFALKASFRGANDQHEVVLEDGKWYTEGEFFRNWGTSSHIMAIQRVLDTMLVPEARQPADYPAAMAGHSETVSL